jgi:hypothetical protein
MAAGGAVRAVEEADVGSRSPIEGDRPARAGGAYGSPAWVADDPLPRGSVTFITCRRRPRSMRSAYTRQRISKTLPRSAETRGNGGENETPARPPFSRAQGEALALRSTTGLPCIAG